MFDNPHKTTFSPLPGPTRIEAFSDLNEILRQLRASVRNDRALERMSALLSSTSHALRDVARAHLGVSQVVEWNWSSIPGGTMGLVRAMGRLADTVDLEREVRGGQVNAVRVMADIYASIWDFYAFPGESAPPAPTAKSTLLTSAQTELEHSIEWVSTIHEYLGGLGQAQKTLEECRHLLESLGRYWASERPTPAHAASGAIHQFNGLSFCTRALEDTPPTLLEAREYTEMLEEIVRVVGEIVPKLCRALAPNESAVRAASLAHSVFEPKDRNQRIREYGFY